MPTAAEVIAQLQLEPLPSEGGFFRRTYTSAAGSPGGRAMGTAIYFLITPEAFSALHLLSGEEIWHFYAGDPVEHLSLDDIFNVSFKTILGPDLSAGQVPQLVVGPSYWQGARLVPGGAWALLGCTMSPGWDEREFTLGVREELRARFPDWAVDIQALTR